MAEPSIVAIVAPTKSAALDLRRRLGPAFEHARVLSVYPPATSIRGLRLAVAIVDSTVADDAQQLAVVLPALGGTGLLLRVVDDGRIDDAESPR